MIWVKDVEELADLLLELPFLVTVLGLTRGLIDVVHFVVELNELIVGQDAVIIRVDALEKHQEFAQEPLVLSQLEVEDGLDQAAELRLVMLWELLDLTLLRVRPSPLGHSLGIALIIKKSALAFLINFSVGWVQELLSILSQILVEDFHILGLVHVVDNLVPGGVLNLDLVALNVGHQLLDISCALVRVLLFHEGPEHLSNSALDRVLHIPKLLVELILQHLSEE